MARDVVIRNIVLNNMEQYMSTPTQKQAYSVNEFIAAFSIGRTMFYREVKEGRLKIHKIGTKTIVKAIDANSWLETLAEAAK
jgi:chemotaxis methyl-accepting protein methylase